MTVPVSVLVPTLDEELNLPECLASLSWADEVFVVDSFSRDRTLEIAQAHGAQVVQHAFESYSRQKNWALSTLPFRKMHGLGNDFVVLDTRAAPLAPRRTPQPRRKPQRKPKLRPTRKPRPARNEQVGLYARHQQPPGRG